MPPSRYTRRSALRLGGLGLLSSVSGCVASNDSRSPSPTTAENTAASQTSTETLAVGETASIGEGSVTIHSVQAQRAIEVLDSSGVHTKVVRPAGRQFAVIRGTISDPLSYQQARNNLVLQLDGEQVSISDYYFSSNRFEGFGFPFAVPLDTQVEQAALLWKDSETRKAKWNLSSSFTNNLNNPPRFEVRSFTVPERVAPEEEIPVRIEVANTGKRGGTFLAKLGVESMSGLGSVRFFVSKDKSVSRQEPVGFGADTGQVRVILDWGSRRLERTVSIQE